MQLGLGSGLVSQDQILFPYHVAGLELRERAEFHQKNQYPLFPKLGEEEMN